MISLETIYAKEIKKDNTVLAVKINGENNENNIPEITINSDNVIEAEHYDSELEEFIEEFIEEMEENENIYFMSNFGLYFCYTLFHATIFLSMVYQQCYQSCGIIFQIIFILLLLLCSGLFSYKMTKNCPIFHNN